MIEVDKDVPVPTARRHRRFPWNDLQPGDSFFVPGRTAKNFGGAVGTARRRHPDWLIAVRTVTENGVKGVRVWRVE